jgi:hypothetical protein
MKFSIVTVLTTLMAGSAIAAPAPAAEVKSMSAQTTWTIENMKRVCNSADTGCTWTFVVNAGSAGKNSCNFTVVKTGNTPASRVPNTGSKCGPYTITSGWSGQFAEGFTTLSVVNQSKKQIAWPAYTDGQLKGNKVVKPDQSYPVQALP